MSRRVGCGSGGRRKGARRVRGGGGRVAAGHGRGCGGGEAAKICRRVRQGRVDVVAAAVAVSCVA